MTPARAAAWAALRAATLAPAGTNRAERMESFVDAAWTALAPTGVSWLGFYLERPGAPEHERLLLGPRRDRPACSPIGLHGACGRAFLDRSPLVVRDVADLGSNYVACDPRDRSELVVPCFGADGECWGVFDLDSHALAAFDLEDADMVRRALAAAGLSTPLDD